MLNLGRLIIRTVGKPVHKYQCQTVVTTTNKSSRQSSLLTGIYHISSLRRSALLRNTKLRRARSASSTSGTCSSISSTVTATATTVTTAATATVANSKIASTSIPYKSLASWLFGCAGMVFGMVVVGGSTRLTRSGLSMTDWKVTGRLPPLNDEEWEMEFAKYRNFPEYKRLNMSMTKEEFKSIYWWEWGHRMWGRAIGVVFVAPLLYFAAKRQIPKNQYGRLALLMGMGGGQGLIGWWMVRSGLEHTHVFGIERSEHDTPRVSPYRLTTHLSMAFATYGLLSWTAMDLWRLGNGGGNKNLIVEPATKALKRLRGVSTIVTGILGITVLSGGFVAGNDAGRAYNDWPLMAGKFIPEEIWKSDLGVRNIFENTATVQFDHRMLATATVTCVASILMMAKQPSVWSKLPLEARTAILTMTGVTCGQYALGVTALMNYVPVELGVAHQAGALTTWTAAIILMNVLKHAR
jgi:heme a synthase